MYTTRQCCIINIISHHHDNALSNNAETRPNEHTMAEMAHSSSITLTYVQWGCLNLLLMIKWSLLPCGYWWLNDPFYCMPLLTIEWSLLLCILQQKLPMLFNGPVNSAELPLPVGDLDSHLIHGSLGPPESAPQTSSWLVQPFLHCTSIWPTYRQTDRYTDRHTNQTTCDICSNRPHLWMHEMWHKKYTKIHKK